MTTLELIAVEVLRGNMAAARGMVDLITEEEARGIRMPPVKHIKVDVNKLRVVVYFNTETILNGAEIDYASTHRAVVNWLEAKDHTAPLMIVGVDRIELYEMG